MRANAKEWFGTKKRQRRKSKKLSEGTNRKKASKNIANASRIKMKNFDIFVTDFLTDPCGLPVELRDYVLVDGTTPLNDGSDLSSSNSNQVLKKIFSNNESMDRLKKTSTPVLIEEPAKKTEECDQRIHV